MNFCVFGAGAWGTAMATHLVGLGHSVTLVPRRMEHALAIASERENSEYLPGIALDQNLQVGCETRPVLMETEVILLACPSKALRKTCSGIKEFLGDARQAKCFLALCKGLEPDSLKLPHVVIQEELGEGVTSGYLTGPSYAREIAEGKPAALVLAINGDRDFASRIQTAVSSPTLRAYLSSVLAGAGLGSCLKNIYAIATGILDGLQLGENARAALITRSLYEMIELGEALGGMRTTFYGLSGFGDLVATCTGDWSRNRTLGLEIGRGQSPLEIISKQNSVVEGYAATECFHSLCLEKSLDAPILTEVWSILHENKPPREALQSLMNSDLKSESLS